MTMERPTMLLPPRLAGPSILGALAIAGLAAVAVGVPAGPAGAAASRLQCRVLAFVDDPDPNGLNVRARPTTKSRVIARLRNRHERDVVVSIRGQRGRWFLIVRATGGRKNFSGRGWVHGSRIGVQVRRRAVLRGAPRRSAKAVGRAPARETFPKLIGCSGRWVRVRQGKRSGWVSFKDYCAGTETTCS